MASSSAILLLRSGLTSDLPGGECQARAGIAEISSFSTVANTGQSKTNSPQKKMNGTAREQCVKPCLHIQLISQIDTHSPSTLCTMHGYARDLHYLKRKGTH